MYIHIYIYTFIYIYVCYRCRQRGPWPGSARKTFPSTLSPSALRYTFIDIYVYMFIYIYIYAYFFVTFHHCPVFAAFVPIISRIFDEYDGNDVFWSSI